MIGNIFYNKSAKRFVLMNRYFKITQFYPFVKDTAFRGGSVIGVFVLLLLGLELFVLDFDTILDNLVETYSAQVIFSVFLVSETILGLIPPEIFIAWASQSVNPWMLLFLLATVSYLGGIIAYFLGGRLFLIPAVRNYIENKIAKHIVNLRKWGGLFVLLGAVSPIPHSMVSMASGLIKYSFKQYLLWSLFRYVRFAIYGAIIFQVF